MKPKETVTKAAALVWDAFPPPPPEAGDWQPDPDSIPKAGNIPDPRFNRDPEQDRRSKSYRKEAKMYGQALSEIPLSPSTKGSSLGRGLGQWPTPAARSTGYPRDFMQDVKPTSPSLESITVLETSRKHPPISAEPTTRVAGPPKGTMELMPAPNYRRPEILVSSTGKSASPTKSLSSGWKAPIEKAIAEDERKLDVSVDTTTTSRPGSVHKISIPPHLRNKFGDEDKTVPLISSVQSFDPSLNPSAKAYEVMAWEMASADSGIEHARHGLHIQQDILDQSVIKQPTPNDNPSATPDARAPPDHGTKLRVMLIRAMEHELDLEKVAPERKLMAMQRAELDRYYDKVCSAHQQWWGAMRRA
ncbi:hypothetical protein AA0112_g3618 [Alternaria arborescens]|nr:hypothetical protein AA0112_g3618 [Alternaria arborescens]